MRQNSRKLLILTYHRVLEEIDQLVPDQTDAEQFRTHIGALASVFNVLPLSDAYRRLQKGTLPRRAVSITFDDGYKDNATVALPILQGRDLSATFFVATNFLGNGRMWNDTIIEAVRRCEAECLDLHDLGLGQYATSNVSERRSTSSALLSTLKYLPLEKRSNTVHAIADRIGAVLPTNLMMNSEDIKLLFDSGMEIGAHTESHPILTSLPGEIARQEIVRSKQILEAMIDAPVVSFAYPNGIPEQDYDRSHVEMVQEAGFRLAVTTSPGCVRKNSDPLQYGRFSVWDRTSMRFCVRLISKFFAEGPNVVHT